MIKSHPDIQGLRLRTGAELHALAVADDSQVVSITTVVLLNGCAWVIKIFCRLSGMVINWNKTIAICSPGPRVSLPGDLNHVSAARGRNT